MTVEELNIVITATNRQFNEALDDIMSRLEGLEEQSQRTADNAGSIFAKLGGMLAGLGLGKIIGDSIMSGGELEQQLGGVEVVFREHAESMKEAAATAFKDMGLSESDYLANANKMGALLKGSGFDTGYASAVSQQVMQRASDVASIMGVDVKDAMEAVTGAARGNFTMMDNLGVAMNDTTLQAYAQEKGLGALETTQQKVNAAMQMFLDKTEYAAGNYARENDTFSGSLTTAKAQLENLTADLGTQLLPTATTLVTMARDGLELVSPLVVSLGEGLNSVGQYLLGMSPSAKTMLGIAVAAAVAIPAVTKAQQLHNSVLKTQERRLEGLTAKQIAWNKALTKTFGIVMVISTVLSVVASIGATAREMNESESAAMEDTAAGADKAAESTDSLSDSMAGLGKSADTAKKKLADIDTLNIFDSGSSTGGVDFSAIVDGAESAQDSIAGLTDDLADVTGNLDELSEKTNSFSLDGLAKNFGNTFEDIKTGFVTMWNSMFGSGKEQYDSLVAWYEAIKQSPVFGWFAEDFKNLGSTLYQTFMIDENTEEHKKALENIDTFLTEIDNKVSGWFDSWTNGFGTKWSNFWKDIGFSFNESNREHDMEASQMFSTLYQDILDSLVDHLKSGESAEDALKNAKHDLLGNNDLASYYFYDDTDWDERINLTLAYDLQKSLKESGQIVGADYDYADYSAAQSMAAVIPGGLAAASGDIRPLTADETKQVFEIHNYTVLDGQILGETVTQYQNNEQTRSNGY